MEEEEEKEKYKKAKKENQKVASEVRTQFFTHYTNIQESRREKNTNIGLLKEEKENQKILIK